MPLPGSCSSSPLARVDHRRRVGVRRYPPAMAEPIRVYERERLYEQVWARPVRTVAKDYGVSGVALAKVCKRLRVPLPGRGYWASSEEKRARRRVPL